MVGTGALDGVGFVCPAEGQEEKAAIADAGQGVPHGHRVDPRDHGLFVGERLFPSETVLLENTAETDAETRAIAERLFAVPEPA